MVRKLHIGLAGVGIAALGVVGLILPAAALKGSDHTTQPETHKSSDTTTPATTEVETHKSTTETTETHKTTAVEDKSVKQAEVKTRVQGKLNDDKKKICDNRSTTVKTIMSRAGEAGQRNLNTFNTIQTRVTEFYTKKQLNVGNYIALKAAADAKYAAAAAAVKAVKDSQPLDCNGTNPVGAADAFKAKVKTMQAALKEYRASVVVLLDAVKTAAKAAEGAKS